MDQKREMVYALSMSYAGTLHFYAISKLQVNLNLVPAHFILLIIKVELKQLLRVFHEIFYQVALQECLTTDHDSYFG